MSAPAIPQIKMLPRPEDALAPEMKADTMYAQDLSGEYRAPIENYANAFLPSADREHVSDKSYFMKSDSALLQPRANAPLAMPEIGSPWGPALRLALVAGIGYLIYKKFKGVKS